MLAQTVAARLANYFATNLVANADGSQTLVGALIAGTVNVTICPDPEFPAGRVLVVAKDATDGRTVAEFTTDDDDDEADTRIIWRLSSALRTQNA